MKDETLYLIHIAECIGRVESYTQGMSKQAFLDSSLVQDAVIRNLQTMAEATRRLSEPTRRSRPDIEWFKIAGFRNALVHDYLGVDLDKVWNILQNDLPALKVAINHLLNAK